MQPTKYSFMTNAEFHTFVVSAVTQQQYQFGDDTKHAMLIELMNRLEQVAKNAPTERPAMYSTPFTGSGVRPRYVTA